MVERKGEVFWVLGGMALLGLVGLVLMLWLLGSFMQPDPQAPDLREREPRAVTTHKASAPDEARPEPPEDDEPIFDESDRCPVDVLLETGDDEPLEGVRVRGSMGFRSPRAGEIFEAVELELLRWRIEDLPCGVADLRVSARGYVSVRREDVDSVVENTVVVRLVRGVMLRGVVMDVDGEPIPDAQVLAGGDSDSTDDDGVYELRVDPASVRRVTAGAVGYLGDTQVLRLPPDSEEDAFLDFVLYRSREVTVWCAGLPDDSCASVSMIMCTWTLLPWGEPCHGEPVVCRCPEGRVAVRGGGKSVEVGPGEDEAWLDFREMGSLGGRVTHNGEPTGCRALVSFSPDSLLDLREGLVNVREAHCDSEGRFMAAGLSPGRWNVQIMHGGTPSLSRFAEVKQGRHTDAGTFDLTGGGTIRGEVIDALTEQGAPGEVVMAVRTDVSASEPPGMSMDISGSEGVFEIQGLDDGSYEVLCSSRPFAKESVGVHDGEADREVVLTTGAADLLEDNGFSLITDEAGELEVDRVLPDSPAEDAGLRSGDIVVGVLIGGMDIGALLPIPSEMLLEAVLEHYPGPGVSLVVDRDGKEHTIDLGG